MADPIQDSEFAKQNEIRRRITLEGPKDPDNYIMLDGRTLTETREATAKEHAEEGAASAEAQLEHMREQSIKDDPMYAKPPEPKAALSESKGSISRGPRTVTGGPFVGRPPDVDKPGDELL